MWIMIIALIAIMYFFMWRPESKRRKQMSEIHTTLGVGSKVMFAGGILGKVVRMSEDEFIGVEIAPKTIIEVSRFAVQAIENK
jgi:preprotein translocase subunit YajC